MRRVWLLIILISLASGCSIMPQIVRQPVMHNPYPQLSKVAVAPFFNLSTEKTVDGRQFALAYFNELQLVPGYEVVPVGVVEVAMQAQRIDLNGPEDARRLAQALGVDALVVGAVTDFSPYYPPRCTLQVEWYAANPNFHPIPPGYGLPWGTPEEKHISRSVIFQAEFALAREQLKTQTPSYELASKPSVNSTRGASEPPPLRQPNETDQEPETASDKGGAVQRTAHQTPAEPPAADTTVADGTTGTSTIPGWPDAEGFKPPPPCAELPEPWPSTGPVMSSMRAFNGHDTEFTKALEDYYVFRDDARFGGWQSYLERSDDLIRFCCHMHIREMLAARGGADETRVVWRWPLVR